MVPDPLCHPENDPIGDSHEFIMRPEDQLTVMFATHISPIEFEGFLPLEMDIIIQFA